MKFWSGLLTSLVLALVGTGCNHTAGVCDCDPWHCHQPLPNPHGVVGGHGGVIVPHGAPVGHAGAPQFPVTPGVGNVYSNAAPTIAPQPRAVPQATTRSAQ